LQPDIIYTGRELDLPLPKLYPNFDEFLFLPFFFLPQT